MLLKQSSPNPQVNAHVASPTGGLTAAGTTQGNAYAIPSGQGISIFTTVASGSGARLPSDGVSPGECYAVCNHGANALAVYPATGGQIGTLGVNAAFSVPAGIMALFMNVGAKAWAVNA